MERLVKVDPALEDLEELDDLEEEDGGLESVEDDHGGLESIEDDHGGLEDIDVEDGAGLSAGAEVRGRRRGRCVPGVHVRGVELPLQLVRPPRRAHGAVRAVVQGAGALLRHMLCEGRRPEELDLPALPERLHHRGPVLRLRLPPERAARGARVGAGV